MVQSDTLSQLHHLNLETNDNDSTVLLPDRLFIAPLDLELAEHIHTAQDKDKVVLEALAAVKSGNVLPMQSTLQDWVFEDGLVYFQHCCYVPPDESLHWELVRRYHDLRPMGHPGQFGTLELL